MDITSKDVLLTTISAFLGSIGGLFIALVLEWLRRPKLILSIADHSDQNPGNIPARYLHVTVTNRPLPQWISWLLARDSALSSYGRMSSSAWMARRYLRMGWTFDGLARRNLPNLSTTAFSIGVILICCGIGTFTQTAVRTSISPRSLTQKPIVTDSPIPALCTS